MQQEWIGGRSFSSDISPFDGVGFQPLKLQGLKAPFGNAGHCRT
jgi:hypothetical protein